ncbi:MAG: hypothetical protein RRY55_08850, partial [Bacteroidales bacterium]
MNNLLFDITYKCNEPENAMLHTWCSATDLGEGLKDILLYLQNGEKLNFSEESMPEGYFKCFVYNGQEDIDELSDSELIIRIETVRDTLKNSGKIEDMVRMRGYDFISSDIEGDCNMLILSIQSDGAKETIEKFCKKLHFILNTVGEGIIPRNFIVLEHQWISIKEILRV